MTKNIIMCSIVEYGQEYSDSGLGASSLKDFYADSYSEKN